MVRGCIVPHGQCFWYRLLIHCDTRLDYWRWNNDWFILSVNKVCTATPCIISGQTESGVDVRKQKVLRMTSTNYRWMQILAAIYSFRGLLCHLRNVAGLQILSAVKSDILQPHQPSKSQHKQMGLRYPGWHWLHKKKKSCATMTALSFHSWKEKGMA